MSKEEKMKLALGNKVSQSTGALTGDKATAATPTTKDPKFDGVKPSKLAKEIEVAKIIPDPGQPRKEFDPVELDQLSNSLKENGQLQPIRVRWDAAAKSYVIISGERRWQAAKKAGMVSLACMVEDRELDPLTLLTHQMIENLNRSDLSDIDKANGIRKLMSRGNLKQKEVAAKLNISASQVTRSLALLDLPAEVQDQVHSGDLPAATAHKLTELESPADQIEMADRIVAEGLSRDSASTEINLLNGQRELERMQAEADPAEVPAGPELDALKPGDGGSATATKIKPKPKAKDAKKPARVLKAMAFNHGGYKLTAERSKGIELPGLLTALKAAVESVESRIATPIYPPMAN